jgi:hypothetical protein
MASKSFPSVNLDHGHAQIVTVEQVGVGVDIHHTRRETMFSQNGERCIAQMASLSRVQHRCPFAHESPSFVITADPKLPWGTGFRRRFQDFQPPSEDRQRPFQTTG